MDDALATRYEDDILATLGPPGRLIAWSKTSYHEHYPRNLAVFNANVCLGQSKVWHGDLDLTRDEPLLLDLAARTGQITSVLYESHGRFRHEDEPLIDRAVFSAAPSGHSMFDPRRTDRGVDGYLYTRAYPRPPRWRRPARPHLWRFWKLDTRVERSRTPERTQTSRFLRVGRHGQSQATPLLVLGLHTWSSDARGAWVEWTWYPTGHRGWAPTIRRRAKLHAHHIRPYASVRIAPGVAHEVCAGVIVGPIDFVEG
jgi:hypothetical protein